MIDFSDYSQKFNKIGLLYLGAAPEIVVQLNHVVSIAKQSFPDLCLSLFVRPDFCYLGGRPENELDRSQFGHIKDFRIVPSSGQHCVLDLIRGMEFPVVTKRVGGKTVLICPDASPVNQSMSEEQVSSIKRIYPSARVIGSDVFTSYHGEVDLRPRGTEKFNSIENALLVIGCENEFVYLAAARGIEVEPILANKELFNRLFPKY